MFKKFFIQNNFEFELVIGVSERIVCKYLSVQKNLPNFITANYGWKKQLNGQISFNLYFNVSE